MVQVVLRCKEHMQSLMKSKEGDQFGKQLQDSLENVQRLVNNSTDELRRKEIVIQNLEQTLKQEKDVIESAWSRLDERSKTVERKFVAAQTQALWNVTDVKQSYEKLLEQRSDELTTTRRNLNQKIQDWKERHKERNKELKRLENEFQALKQQKNSIKTSKAVQCDLKAKIGKISLKEPLEIKSIIKQVSLPSSFRSLFSPRLFSQNAIIPPCNDALWAHEATSLIALKAIQYKAHFFSQPLFKDKGDNLTSPTLSLKELVSRFFLSQFSWKQLALYMCRDFLRTVVLLSDSSHRFELWSFLLGLKVTKSRIDLDLGS